MNKDQGKGKFDGSKNAGGARSDDEGGKQAQPGSPSSDQGKGSQRDRLADAKERIERDLDESDEDID